MTSLGGAFFAVIQRDLSIAMRHRGDLLNPLFFFLIVVTLVPLGISPEPTRLAAMAPGMIWISALLATLLALDNLFQADFADGSLVQLMLSPEPLWLLVLAKIIAHWLVTGLPVVLFSPLLGMILSLPGAGFLPLLLGLALGTAVFSLLGAVGAALTVALHKGSVLLSLLVMPLYVPVLIFGTSAVQRAVDGMNYGGVMAILAAVAAFSLLLAPFAAAGALKVGING
ncbi:heme exporter protein CcmB [Gammaproteobacteria bacterium 53_120_T64]|nr:heme exporter protein CcmB [Gammaproteobacteria bacterium 53_120_T64]